jgi:hypothetical protein
MVPSTSFGLKLPIVADDIMTARPGNRPSRCSDWQFGLRKIRVAELAYCFSVICRRFAALVTARLSQRGSRQNVSPDDDALHHRVSGEQRSRP